MKKSLVTIAMVLLMISTQTAAFTEIAVEASMATLEVSTIAPRAEETGWIHRLVGDVLQRRLWSYTRGIWLTDWLDC